MQTVLQFSALYVLCLMSVISVAPAKKSGNQPLGCPASGSDEKVSGPADAPKMLQKSAVKVQIGDPGDEVEKRLEAEADEKGRREEAKKKKRSPERAEANDVGKKPAKKRPTENAEENSGDMMSEGKRIEAERQAEEEEKAAKAAKKNGKAERRNYRKRISGKKPAKNRPTGHAAGNSGDMMSEGKRIEAERQAEEEEKAAKAAKARQKAKEEAAKRKKQKADDSSKTHGKDEPDRVEIIDDDAPI